MNFSRRIGENFMFAFNNFDFSDRILRLEITPEENAESCDSAKVTTLHINSPILAVNSPFFYKLFKNGMRESQEKSDVCFKIKASEEAALMNLLRFMYGETALNVMSSADLVDLLIVADKFEVASCMIYCAEMLNKFPMSLELAMLYLDLPCSVLVSEFVKPIIDAAKGAKQFIFAMFKDFTKSQDEAMQLTVSALELVLGSEGLQVVSEDVVFDFVLKWARASYPELEGRREILTKRLAPLICFTNMSVTKLKEVMACADFDDEHVLKSVVEALFSKVEPSCMHLIRDSMDLSSTQCHSVGRVYLPQCVVFFDIAKNECAGLFPLNRLNSPTFWLSGIPMYLRARCGLKKDRFGLFVRRVKDSETCTLDLDLAVMKKSSMEYESRWKAHNHTPFDGWGEPDLLGISWTELMNDDCDYFINGVLHLRVELTLKA